MTEPGTIPFHSRETLAAMSEPELIRALATGPFVQLTLVNQSLNELLLGGRWLLACWAAGALSVGIQLGVRLPFNGWTALLAAIALFGVSTVGFAGTLWHNRRSGRHLAAAQALRESLTAELHRRGDLPERRKFPREDLD